MIISLLVDNNSLLSSYDFMRSNLNDNLISALSVYVLQSEGARNEKYWPPLTPLYLFEFRIYIRKINCSMFYAHRFSVAKATLE